MTPPLLFLRKNLILRMLEVHTAQECDSKGVMKDGWPIERFAWFQNGKSRAGVTLYTSQYNKLVNGCQMKVGQKSNSHFENGERQVHTPHLCATERLIHHRVHRGHRGGGKNSGWGEPKRGRLMAEPPTQNQSDPMLGRGLRLL